MNGQIQVWDSMRRSSIGKGNVTMGAVKPIELIAGAREVEAVEEILEKI